MARVTVVVDGDRHEGTSSLAAQLLDDYRLRGTVHLAPAPPQPGALGSVLHELAVTLGSDAAAMAFASIAITWLKRRVGSVRLKISRPDGTSIEMSAEHVRGLDEAGLRAQVAQLAAAVSPRAQDTTDDGPSPGGQ